MSNFSAQYLLREILQFADYTLARVSDETGISRTTLSRIYHNCYSMVHLRNFNKLFRLYCRLLSSKRFYA
jgi:hypothetical protein